MRAYYIVMHDGMKETSDVVQFPHSSDDTDIITYMHGLMFETDWCPQTAHAIYLNRHDSGYECIYDEGDADEAAFATQLEELETLFGCEAP